MEANAFLEKKKRVEIFPPSFFNIHLPFAGTFLTAFASLMTFFVLTTPFLPLLEGLGGKNGTFGAGAETVFILGAGPESRTESSLSIIFQNY